MLDTWSLSTGCRSARGGQTGSWSNPDPAGQMVRTCIREEGLRTESQKRRDTEQVLRTYPKLSLLH